MSASLVFLYILHRLPKNIKLHYNKTSQTQVKIKLKVKYYEFYYIKCVRYVQILKRFEPTRARVCNVA